jgi:hypothetical protein
LIIKIFVIKINFRLKINSTDDQIISDIDIYVTPVTPLYQPGTFGAMEPAITPVTTDFIIPPSEYKWNQIIELQLADGKKVLFKNKINHIN